jgi:phage terminase small subunit
MGLKGPPPGRLKPWDEMTEQQQTFVNEYMRNGHNATQAYKDAGYWCGQSKGAIRVMAHKVRYNQNVAAAIQERMDMLIMTEKEALSRQSEVGRFDVGELLTCDPIECPECGHVIQEEGEWRVDLNLAKELGVTDKIKKISYDRHGRLNVEFRDPDAAQRTMMRAHGAFGRKKEDDGLAGLAALLKAAKANAAEQNNDGPKVEDAEVISDK